MCEAIAQRSLKEAEGCDAAAADGDHSCVVHYAQDMYLDIGGVEGAAVSKFRFLKHSHVPNCTLELRRVRRVAVADADALPVQTASDPASSADADAEAAAAAAAAAPTVLLCVVALRRIAPGVSLSIDFSQR